MKRYNACLLFRGDIEKCVRHAERLKNMLAKVVFQSLATDFFNQLAEPVRTDSILPSRSGIEQEWRLQKAIVSLTRRGDRSGSHIAVQLWIEKVVGEPGCVRKQLPDGGKCVRRPEFRFSRAGIEFLEYLNVGKLREVGRSGFIQFHASALDELHNAHRCDRLGHRSYVENRIYGHRDVFNRI